MVLHRVCLGSVGFEPRGNVIVMRTTRIKPVLEGSAPSAMGLFVLEVTDRSFQVSTTPNLHCVRTVAEKTESGIHARNRVLFMLSSGAGVEFGQRGESVGLGILSRLYAQGGAMQSRTLVLLVMSSSFFLGWGAHVLAGQLFNLFVVLLNISTQGCCQTHQGQQRFPHLHRNCLLSLVCEAPAGTLG